MATIITKSMISFSRMSIPVIKNIAKSDKQKEKRKALSFPHRERSVVNVTKPTKVKRKHQGPRESTFKQNKIHLPCNRSPKTLCQLCCDILNKMPFPNPFKWSVLEVRNWIINVVGYPEYANCFVVNQITGKRLLEFTDPSVMPKVGINKWTHIKHICESVRKLFSVEMGSYFRSVGLPRKLPTTLMTEFKSKTGPPWGIRENFTRCEILRWYRILNEEPGELDHWDAVWYQRQTFPKYVIARVVNAHVPVDIPKYVPGAEEKNYEYTVERKFLILGNIPESQQHIWVDERHYGRVTSDTKVDAKSTSRRKKYVDSIRLTDYTLARRKRPKTKFEIVTYSEA